MSSLKLQYKKQVDELCMAGCSVTAEDILAKARERQLDAAEVIDDKTDSNISDKAKGSIVKFEKAKKEKAKAKKAKKAIWKMVVAAASVLLICTTTLATTGKLSEWYDKYFGDEKEPVTKEIIKEGYLYDINQSVTDGIFSVDLIGVTGDAETPKLAMDIYINDDALAAAHDEIRLMVYILGTYQYENELDLYSPWEGHAKQDENVPNLYHMVITGPPVWMCNGEEVVVDVWQIVMDEDAEIWDDRYPNIKFRYTAPADIFYPVSYFEYEDMKFSQGGIDYYLTRGEYGPYRSELLFEYDYEGTTLVGGEDNYLELEGKLQDNWLQLVDTMVLVVDGVEYPVNAEDKGYTYCDEKGEFGKKNHCNIHPYFPSIDLETAESIVIKAGDTSYILK
ncbi:MAG: hypothetical protein IJZ96_09290 [Lachnospiraceae bacterium]|nr:hypothetical protein [Lachnospiraceae bacterium]